MVIEVIINRNGKKMDRGFDYHVPSHLEEEVCIGSKVFVTFGKGQKQVEAFVIKIKEKSEYLVKDIIRIENSISDEQMELAKWMSKKYYTSLSSCIGLMLTPGSNSKSEKIVKEKHKNCLELNCTVEEIKSRIESGDIKSEKHIEVLRYVFANKEVTVPDIEKNIGISRGIVNTVVKNGYLKVVEVHVKRNSLDGKEIGKTVNLELTEEQKNAFEKIMDSVVNNYYSRYLIHGVTGSGKTEIYIQLIEEVVARGKQAIMLVPEISLTPQMLDRFISRFGKERIAIIHSKLSVGERFDQWNRIQNDEVDIVIGARSAIFAPVKDLGIIIVDEEHDSSYKSESNPKYNAKEVAEFVGWGKGIPVVFGSATPDIVNYYNIKDENEEKILILKQRANKSKLPEVEIVDLRDELANGNRSMLSRSLYEKMTVNIKEKYQTILFLNRRGYSTFVMCRDCGHTVKCKHCDISLTYHEKEQKLRCHYCGYEESVAKICPECSSDKIKYFGTGTQKVESEIKNIFKGSKTIRMDVDTVTKKNSHEEILNRFKNEDIDILVGTQMVVKGHHFPRVTLVGVMAADGSLNIDDFRAAEKTFQILTQVAGRAGREKLEGKVVVQTYNPDNFAILCAKEHNYDKFYETEIMLRKQLKYPPFCDIILISFVGEKEQEIIEVSKFVFEYLKTNLNEDDFNIFKPMVAPVAKIQNKLRWRMIIKGSLTKEANIILNDCLDEAYKLNIKNTHISIDVNANNMM